MSRCAEDGAPVGPPSTGGVVDGTSRDHLGGRPRQGPPRRRTATTSIRATTASSTSGWRGSTGPLTGSCARRWRTAQWDPQKRLTDLATQGVVAEVLFANGTAVRRARPSHPAARADPPGQHGLQPVAGRLLLRRPGPPARAGAGQLRRRRSGRRRRPLGEGARPRRHPDAAPDVTTRSSSSTPPWTRSGPPSRRSASRSASTGAPARPTTSPRASPRSWCWPPSTPSSPAARCGR